MKAIAQCLYSLVRHLDSRTRLVFVVYTSVLTSTTLLDGYVLIVLGRRLSESGGLSLDNQSNLVFIFAVAGLLILKSLLALLITAVGYRVFANAESRMSLLQLSQLLSVPWTEAEVLKVGDFTRRVDYGPQYAFQFLLMMASLIAEIFVVVVSLGTYLVFDPLVGLAILIYFTLILFLQTLVLNRKMNRVSNVVASSTTEVHSRLAEMSQLAKYLRVNQHSSLIDYFSSQRTQLAKLRNLGELLQNTPRFLFEGIIAIGFGVLVLPSLLLRGSDDAIRSAVFFAVVLFRIVPSLIRIQALVLALVGRVPFVNGLDLNIRNTRQQSYYDRVSESDTPLIELHDVAFRYSSETPWLVRNLSLRITRGNFYAITGPSGSGKTTLLDLLLALRAPSNGLVVRSRVLRLAYLPQDTLLLSGGLMQNVSMTWKSSRIDRELVCQSLRTARLEEFAASIERGSNPLIESNLSISGGQRQRIGIARALYTRPTLLVLDEPSSAVDQDTTHQIMANLRTLDNAPAVVMVTHDESLLKYFDFQIEVSEGFVRQSSISGTLQQ